MAHKIGIISKNLSFYNLINQQRRSDTNFEMEYLKTIDSLKNLRNTGKFISSFVFDSSLAVDDIVEFGKYIKGNKSQQSALIFLAFDDFETFQAITTNEHFSNAKIINMPATASEIYSKVTTETAQLDNKTHQKSKTDGSISSASFLNIFIESTMATIKDMTMCENITHGPPGLLDYQKLEQSIAIRGKLAIKSPYFTGSFFISFPEETYLKVCSKVLFEEVTKIEKDNEDLVSELCNIIYGKSKVMIAKLDMKLDMVIPTYNRDPKVVSSASVLIVKLSSEMGDFYIKVAPGLI